jgi:EAL domain-containing protein (putative c-di-GMP-specific phosphodiesterase class I)/anti-sigma regulatory factor (Ser/Thr protein kinase)
MRSPAELAASGLGTGSSRTHARPSRRLALLVTVSSAVAVAASGYLLAQWASPSPSAAPGQIYVALVAFGVLLGTVSWLVGNWMAGQPGIRSWLLRPKVVRDVRRGIERNEFELHFQPQIGIETGQPCAAEALLRWRRNDELRSPGDFLSDVEASGAIGPLTDHILELALEQAGRWAAAGRPIKLSVNLSPANLRDAALAERLRDRLERHQVVPSMLTLEVTETAVLEEPEQARAVLDAIAGLGVSISVDDFGTGYSSLLWLRLFPVTEVKIDRTFVSALASDGEAYVVGVIRLAHDLGLSVVAEGIEDDTTLQMLEQLGCDIGQGYLFSRPVPAPQLEAWFEEHTDDRWAPRHRELHLPAELSSLDAARDLVQEAAIELGYDSSAVWDMRVAATEALANAIEHGPSTGDGLVHLKLSQEGGSLRLEISGGGGEPGPQLDTAEVHRGRGFAIMTALMDDVGVRRESDDTLVRLAKKRTPTTR